MKKKVLGTIAGLMMLLGSSMCVCAEEPAPEQTVQTPQVQQYQPMMTPEILASFELNVDDMDETVLSNALVRRTDAWGQLQDNDGDGIDDRDPINGCGYLDLNCNGFDDRFEMSVVGSLAQEDVSEANAMQMMFNLLSHSCKHGIVYSDFLYDDSVNSYWSVPDYFDKCEECSQAFVDGVDQLDQIGWGL